MPDTPPFSHLTYLDFDLEIGPIQGGEYPLVARSPAGEARARLRLPFSTHEQERYLDKLQIALLRSGGQRRQALSPEEKLVREFGQKLFDALLNGEVRSRYDACQSQAVQKGQGLRLKLHIQPPELAVLPWEFLYDARRADYLCFSKDTPLVRYIDMPQPVGTLAVPPPLRILGMVASPQGAPDLDIEGEKKRLETALEALQRDGLAQVTWLEGQTWRDLQRALRSGPWHIFHFIGHGGFDAAADEGFLALCDEHGRADLMPATKLARLLADHRSLRLAVLNACEGAHGGEQDIFSSTAAVLVRRGLPSVLAMQYPITDRAALEFSRTFYEALAGGLPVDAAVCEARTAISMEVKNSLEWGTPVLYMRTADGMLFEVMEQGIGDKGVRDRDRKTVAKEQWDFLDWLRETLDDNALGTATESQASPVPDVPKPVAKPQTPATGSSETRPAPQILTPKSQIVTPPPPEISLTLAPGVDLLLRYVEAGEFLMGSDKKTDPGAYNDELPQHKLHLDGYFIGEYPVTNAQYQAFVRATGRAAPQHWKNGVIPQGKEQHPVVNVDWQAALAFCEWASQVAGKPLRLPSEAEWEKAASWQPSPPSLVGKGAGGLGQKRIYPWGDAFDRSKCNTGESGIGDTTPVGKYSPHGDSPYGCADMAGNVWEWTCSLWGQSWNKLDFPYPYDAKDGREDLQAEGFRVVHGGSWNNGNRHARCASRYRNLPTYYDDDLGFRVGVGALRPISGS